MWAWLSLLDICIGFALMNTCRACCPPREQLHAPSSHCGGSDCWAGKLPGGSWEDWPKCECERSGLHTAKYMRWESKSSIYTCWKWHGACLHFFVKDLVPPISGVSILHHAIWKPGHFSSCNHPGFQNNQPWQPARSWWLPLSLAPWRPCCAIDRPQRRPSNLMIATPEEMDCKLLR